MYHSFDENYFIKQSENLKLPMNKKIKEFSTGMKAKLRVLTAMTHHAKLLIMDEPTAGLDPRTRVEFKEILKDKKNIINRIVKEFNRIYKKKEDNEQYENELMTELAKLKKTREKYMDMYTDDLISREELNEKIGGMKKKIEKLENELKLVEYNLNKGDQLEEIVQHTFKNIEGITSVADMTNEQLKQIIQKIEVDKEGNVDIYLRIFGDLGLDDSVLISYDHT